MQSIGASPYQKFVALRSPTKTSSVTAKMDRKILMKIMHQIFAENPRSHAAGSVSGSRDEDLMECDVPREKGL
jgi:hypothetical protein